jgi:iron complex outermembrane receptor protein
MRSRPLAAALCCAVLILLTPFGLAAQTDPSSAGTVTGTVLGDVLVPAGEAAAGLTVTLVELRRSVTVEDDGGFRFDDVPAGLYLVLVESPTAGTGVERVEVAAGETARVTLALEVSLVRDELVVTATAEPRRQLEVVQPTNVLTGENLELRRAGTLGETLDEQPGVSATGFGPGASRPVIRGSGGDRIRVLEDGLGAADVSSSSPDHAVSIDPLTAERVEVVRGPATLLYGSSAVGGVVNVFDGRIPDSLPEETFSGSAQILGGSAADERSGSLHLDGRVGSFAWHANGSSRETDDVEIPVGSGVLDNSATETASGSFGASWVGDGAFLGVSVSGFDTLYGVPGHGHEGEEHEGDEHDGEEEEEGDVRIDLEQRRFDLRGEVIRPFGPFQGGKLRAGFSDYEHVELEGSEVGTRFASESIEGRLELVQRRIGRVSGSVGLQVGTSDFVAVGDEAFVPPSTTDTLAVFAFEELAATDDLRLQAGARFETQEIDPDGPGLESRSFDAVSGSLGGIFDVAPGYALAASVARTERIPTANELYADGPHAATRAFEIGNPDFGLETSLGLDVSLRKTEGPVTGSLTLFANRYDDYIYESFTGEEEDELDVVRFLQQDAEFRGAELAVLSDLYRGGDSHVALELSGDLVRAELEETGEPLPRIPPLRLGARVNFHRDHLRGFGELRWADTQDRIGANETPTDGYQLVNAAVSYRFLFPRLVLDLTLKGRNLTDEEARQHTSFLKDEVPLAGRDLSLGVRVFF